MPPTNPEPTPSVPIEKPGILSERYLIILSFLAIYFIWGSTFLANAWALQAFPPFLLSAIRFLTAGGILLLFTYSKGQKGVTLIQLRNACIMGVFMLGIGTGSAMWSIQFLDTGVVALFIGGQPLLLVIFTWILLAQRPGWMKWLGLALGLAGVVVLVTQDQLSLEPGALKGFIAILIALVSWAISAIYFKRVDLPSSKSFSASVQMLAGGVFLFLISLIMQEDAGMILKKWSYQTFLSALYLITFGSLIAYSAFNYLLLKVDATQVTTTNYVNPVIAMLLGWWLNEEVLTQQSLIAAALLIGGVVFINSDKK